MVYGYGNLLSKHSGVLARVSGILPRAIEKGDNYDIILLQFSEYIQKTIYYAVKNDLLQEEYDHGKTNGIDEAAAVL